MTGVNRAKTRTFNKPDIGSDHDLVMMTLKVKLSTIKKNKLSRIRFDIEKLKDLEVAESYQEELAGKFAPLLLLDQDPQDLCDVFTDTLENTAEEKLGKASPIKKLWITPELLEACDVRQEKRRRRHLGTNDLLEYRVAYIPVCVIYRLTFDYSRLFIAHDLIAIHSSLRNLTKRALKPKQG